jgi:hypothetical protein
MPLSWSWRGFAASDSGASWLALDSGASLYMESRYASPSSNLSNTDSTCGLGSRRNRWTIECRRVDWFGNRSFEFALWWWSPLPGAPAVGVLTQQTYQGGTRGSRLCGGGSWSGDQELEGICKDTGHKIYTGSGCQGGEPYILSGDQVWRPALGVGLRSRARLGIRPSFI